MMQRSDDFELFGAEDAGGTWHSLLRAPRILPKDFHPSKDVDDVLNILMADSSGSMEDRWPRVVRGWEEHIVPKLTGRTRIYVFDSQVRFMRNDKHLLQKDYTGYATNLVSAFETILEEVNQCSESNVRVFLVTDGHHNHDFQGREPESVICRLKPPPEKVICVYVLGIGLEFPVNYSIDVRSRLHNGNSNVPTLFLAKEDREIEEQIQAISYEISNNLVTLHLSVEGYILPGLEKTSTICLGEWLYFPCPPESVPSFTVQGYGTHPRAVNPSIAEISLKHLVDEVFPQWTSILIQQHRVKSYVPHEMFDFMTSMFNGTMKRVEHDIEEKGTVKGRLSSNWKRYYAVKFTTLMSQSKNIISVDNKFKDEMELAESVLKTTVTCRKYDQRSWKFKGHAQSEFEEDADIFLELYNEAKDKIISLPDPKLHECCTITAGSTLCDLQDPDFPLLLKENKFDFLKVFTMTGLPAYAPIKNASQINPWVLTIRHIVGFPYCVLSQVALEAFADLSEGSQRRDRHKRILIASDNEDTMCNIIIPIIPSSAAKVLKPLIHSNLYAMMATFCIMKNPHIIDHDAHIAALSCAWFTTIRSFPGHTKPEYIRTRIKDIVATAKIYFSRPAIKRYVMALLSDPNQALMTESTKEFDGHSIKCESLIKPMFFLYTMKNSLTLEQREHMLKILLAEFIGRSLPKHAKRLKRPQPFTDFFSKDVYDPKKEKAWMNNTYWTILKSIKNKKQTLLEAFYTLDELLAAIKREIGMNFPELSTSIINNSDLGVDMERVKKLRNIGGCGDVWTTDFKNWAEEMHMTDESIRKAASPKQIAVYVVEGLMTRSSRDRLCKATMNKSEAEKTILEKVKWENAKRLRSKLMKQMKASAIEQWKTEYLKCHQNVVVVPMTPEQVVEVAKVRGVEVTLDTFPQVYRYNDRLQVLRNACQIPSCPHFVIPRRNFNQHLSIERQQQNFPHALHLVAKEFNAEGVDAVALQVSKGTFSGTQRRHPPTPPQVDSLFTLRDQIKKLLCRYTDSAEVYEDSTDVQKDSTEVHEESSENQKNSTKVHEDSAGVCKDTTEVQKDSEEIP